MAKVILRQEAIDDLNSIWEYTFEKWSEKQADKYYATIKMSCNGIGGDPDIGKEYDGIRKNLLGLKSEKHIIFYEQKSNDRIEIIRILHERMDLKNRILE
jgi:toxin ParE1/3/4